MKVCDTETITNVLFFLLSLLRVAAEGFRQVQLGFDLGEDFTMLAGLFAGVFAALAAEGGPFVVFLLCGPQIGLYAGDGGVAVLLGEFAFPDGNDGPGEGIEALGVEFVAGDVVGNQCLNKGKKLNFVNDIGQSISF